MRKTNQQQPILKMCLRYSMQLTEEEIMMACIEHIMKW